MRRIQPSTLRAAAYVTAVVIFGAELALSRTGSGQPIENNLIGGGQPVENLLSDGPGFDDGTQGSGQPVDNNVTGGRIAKGLIGGGQPIENNVVGQPAKGGIIGGGQPVENLLAGDGHGVAAGDSLIAIGPFFQRGDSNEDGLRDIADPIHILFHLFVGDAQRPLCLKSADVNDDGTVDVSDPLGILQHLFLGGASLPEPFAECGEDPTPDDIPCATPSTCDPGIQT